jgi:hypothetical protein
MNYRLFVEPFALPSDERPLFNSGGLCGMGAGRASKTTSTQPEAAVLFDSTVIKPRRDSAMLPQITIKGFST